MNEEKQKADPCNEGDINLAMPEAVAQKGYHAGDLCPICFTERLDYNGLALLVCPICGQIEGGGFT
jgi:hypothetical protein